MTHINTYIHIYIYIYNWVYHIKLSIFENIFSKIEKTVNTFSILEKKYFKNENYCVPDRKTHV